MNIVFLEPLGLDNDRIKLLTSEFKKLGHNLTVHDTRNEDEDTLISRAENAEIIALSNIKISKRFIHSCPLLKMISVAFTGIDHIDINSCNEKNILVSNSAGFSNESVAELTIGMIISTYRNIAWGDSAIRMGGSRGNYLGSELNGKTIGIIGCGNIGTRVAEICKVFNCKVLAYNRNPKNIDGVIFTDKDTLLKESDIISLHTPLTKETENLITEKDFKLMKPTTILINTARGPIVNKQDLCEALFNNTIAGAAIDVYDNEPPLDKQDLLFNAPNLLMLPHIAYATNESFEKRLNIVIQNIKQWINGTPQNIMN